ncbi:MAG: uroporphyrinogen-III synthase [Bacteroidetes bacterium]|nr:uroporphyrinogen-III synthase [Bacteroidota bacterium]
MTTHTGHLLAGRTIVLTRTAERNEATRPVLESYGANVICFPTVEIQSPPSWEQADSSIWKLAEYTDICFTSYHGTQLFIERIRHIRPKSLETINTRTLIAIGEKIRRTIESLGFNPLSMLTYTSITEFIESLKLQPLAGRKFLHPTRTKCTNGLKHYFQTRDVPFDEVPVYQLHVPNSVDVDLLRSQLQMKTIDAITFFSSSAVLNFIEMLGTEPLRNTVIAAVSTPTAETLKQAGIEPNIIAHPPTAEGLCTTLSLYFQKQQSL